MFLSSVLIAQTGNQTHNLQPTISKFRAACSVTRCFEIFVAQVGDFPLKNSPNGFKCQNIYIKADLKPQKTYIKHSFEMAFIGKKLKMLMSSKVAQKFADFQGKFFILKIRLSLSKVAQMAKNCLIWSHWRLDNKSAIVISRERERESVRVCLW